MVHFISRVKGMNFKTLHKSWIGLTRLKVLPKGQSMSTLMPAPLPVLKAYRGRETAEKRREHIGFSSLAEL